MLIEDLLPLLKTYLDISPTDVEYNNRLELVISSAVGYVKSVYDYDVIDYNYSKLLPVLGGKIYLPDSPVKVNSVVVKDQDGTVIPTDISVVQNTIYFAESLYRDGQFLLVEYSTGVDYSPTTYNGDAENLVQLAGWLYRTADKGMEGMSQFTTGVKEGVHIYEGIPIQITTYFQSKKLMRL